MYESLYSLFWFVSLLNELARPSSGAIFCCAHVIFGLAQGYLCECGYLCIYLIGATSVSNESFNSPIYRRKVFQCHTCCCGILWSYYYVFCGIINFRMSSPISSLRFLLMFSTNY